MVSGTSTLSASAILAGARAARTAENAAAADIILSRKDLESIEALIRKYPDVGNRYGEGPMKLLNR